jgi:hypothetical protein
VRVAFGESVGLHDDLEADLGWSVDDPLDLAGLPTAFSGSWVRADPIGTSAQPEDDRSDDPGTQCWFTGQGSLGGSLGEADIDGGTTTLRSPPMDASTLVDPHLSFWRWFSNQASRYAVGDSLFVDLSADGGTTWVRALDISASGPDTMGGWILEDLRLADFVTPSDALVVRFLATDFGTGGIVEAALDELALVEYDCTPSELELARVEPSEGPAAGGNWVTLRGAGFTPATSVSFGSVAALALQFLSASELRAQVPAAPSAPASGRPLRVDVEASDATVDRLERAYRYVPVPKSP